MDELMLKPIEAAKLLRVGKTQVYRLIKSKEIPSRRVGKSIRIPIAQLRAWAESAPAEAKTEPEERKGRGKKR